MRVRGSQPPVVTKSLFKAQTCSIAPTYMELFKNSVLFSVSTAVWEAARWGYQPAGISTPQQLKAAQSTRA